MLSLEGDFLDYPNRNKKIERLLQIKEPTTVIVLNRHWHDYDVSEFVRVIGTGGRRLTRMWRAYTWGKSLNPDFVTAQDPVITGIPALLIGKKTEIQLHGDFFSDYYKNQSGLYNRVYYWIARYTITRADIIRCAGKRVQESVIALGIPREKTYIKPVSINL